MDSTNFAAPDRLFADSTVLIVYSVGSFMYRVAELMCMPIHHDAQAARRALRNGAG